MRSPSTGLCAAFVLLLCGTAGAQQSGPADNPQTLFFQANTHYQEGAYAEAVKEYTLLKDSGLRSGNLYFNLGNAYFKLGDIGKAIANYERARHDIPGDPDLEANLAYARSQSGVESCAPPFWQRARFPLRGRFSAATLAWIVSAFYSLAIAALIANRLLPARPRTVLWAAGALGALALIAGVSLAVQLAADEWPSYAVVTDTQETAARFEPAEDGTVHFTLPTGTKVEITEERQGWLQVARCDGRRGWVPEAALERL
jgi:tetratricopeptide (TPR) repeat protein